MYYHKNVCFVSTFLLTFPYFSLYDPIVIFLYSFRVVRSPALPNGNHTSIKSGCGCLATWVCGEKKNKQKKIKILLRRELPAPWGKKTNNQGIYLQ